MRNISKLAMLLSSSVLSTLAVSIQAFAAPCGQPVTLISQIQGSGDVSPLQDETHSIEAVVGDFSNGFYVEEQGIDQDANITTSEGLFVASNLVDVNVGDVVHVSGVVTEFFGLTSLSTVSVAFI